MVNSFESASKPKTTLVQSQSVASSTTPGPLPPIVEGVGSSNRTNSSTEYVYQYGVKNLQLNHSLYEQAGIFVTKPIEVEGNIVEVSLSTFEDHPLFNELDGMATDRVTSIEYYISLEENPSLNDWVSILPEGTKNVKCEKLFFRGSSAVLRFHADISDEDNTKVYRNNILMNRSDWYFTERGAAIQLAVPHDSSSIYTIDYVPNASLFDPWTVKVGDRFSKRVRKVESFPNGTDSNNTIKLSKYPFVDYKQVNNGEGYDPNTSDYRPIDVFLTNGSIVVGGGKTQQEFFPISYSSKNQFTTKNRTDYKTSKDVSLNKYSIVPDSVYNTFEYKQEKNKLIFTESFNRSDLYYNEATNHGNATVVVHYDYLVTNFRLKVILRKNVGDELVVTPMVDSYQLKFKVMK
ncbi:hypothetical protein FHY73_14690 [Bacillus tropicus]|uniref:hypothetical protein n=1 Tax=Bacillus tropicus TaxID=2026188 RepID=UPI0011243548|nr:hypothetical protein [Bacillus tropicus]TNP18954.1 hypothetical protein FHY73_14690 [Bacillus tropicus]